MSSDGFSRRSVLRKLAKIGGTGVAFSVFGLVPEARALAGSREPTQSTQSLQTAGVSSARRFPCRRTIHLSISLFRTTALFLSTGRLPLSSTGAASLAQWPQLPIWVRDYDPSPSNIRTLLPWRHCIVQ